MPPDILHLILEQVVDRIKTNARLRLSKNPTENIWAYYNIIKIMPIVLEDFLMVILTIPLIDASLDMNLYKVHNLPMIHPDIGIQAEYILEGQYLATLMNGMYATIPQETDIKLCKMFTGHLCILNEPLCPTDRIDWCMYALFTNDLEKMRKNCIIKPKVCLTNLAHSLDGYLWAISSIGAEKLQICCVHQTRVVTIPPPLHIIDIGNGCEAFSTNIYIPAKSELTATFQSVTHSQFFLKYNLKYQNLTSFVVFYAIRQYELTEQDKTKLCSKVSMLEPMPMGLFEQELTRIDEDYPYTLPIPVMSSMLMGSMCSSLVILGVIIVFCLKHRK